jgi:hypothetical protein
MTEEWGKGGTRQVGPAREEGRLTSGPATVCADQAVVGRVGLMGPAHEEKKGFQF